MFKKTKNENDREICRLGVQRNCLISKEMDYVILDENEGESYLS